MHDTFLLTKISKSLKDICIQSNIEKIDELTVVVNYNSHVNEKNLKECLIENNRELVSDNLKITVQREDIEDQTAIIHSIQGETFDK